MSRKTRFPQYSLFDSLIIAQTIYKKNGGQPMRRLTIFDEMERSPESSTSRTLVTSSSAYSLTQGGYAAEIIELTPLGLEIVQGNNPEAYLKSVYSVEIFQDFFEKYKSSTLPSESAAVDHLSKNYKLNNDQAKKCFSVLKETGKQVHLIQEISGSFRIVSYEHALEKWQSIMQGQITESRTSTQEHNEPSQVTPENVYQSPTSTSLMPAIHLDIQIHISPESTAEQIDQIFASMAKHLLKE
jgi:hypothetical protein